MAIGIIAVAFVTLLSLLPAGLNTYREAIDQNNETWIVQGINSMDQTTEFSRVHELDYEEGKNIFYFDEEGKLTDTELEPGDAATMAKRIYAVKLVIAELYRPSGTLTGNEDQKMPHGLRVIMAIAPVIEPKAMAEFGSINDEDSLNDLPANTKVHTRTFYVARMDSQS